MGSIFGKRKGESKDENSNKEKKRKGKNNPRNLGSTQSLDVDRPVVSSSPNPHTYAQPEVTSRQSGHRSFEDLTGNAQQFVQPQTKPPPGPLHHKMNRNEFQDTSQSFEDLSEPVRMCPPPQSRPPPIPNRETEHNSNDDQDNRDDYLNENKAYHRLEPEKVDSENYYDSPESNSKQQVRADKNYSSNHGSDISFSKGDILQLIQDGEVDGWYFVRKLSTGEEGYAHKDWVTIITSVDVESQKCYFKSLDRNAADEKLLEPEIELGTYLLRPSGGDYALSLRCEDESGRLEIRHYKIRVVAKGICYIDAVSMNTPFSNIVQLIEYYTEQPGLRCKLKTPHPQDIPLGDLAVKFSDLKKGEKLGSGNFGSVYAGILHGKRQVAVKSLRDRGSMTLEEFRNEAETMHKLRHKNLVSLLAICEDRGTIHIITERMSRGSMLDVLRRDSVDFKDLMHMVIQVVCGMCYLEKKGFVHRDLRAANVLVGDENIAKIADFGLTRLLDNYYEDEKFYKEKKGTVFPYKWTAPEAIKQKKFTVKSDVWSFGILLYEMVTHGDEPYSDMSNNDVLAWVEKGNRLKRPKHGYNCPLALYNIMKQCWLKNSDERPRFEYIKDNLVEIKSK